MRLDYQPGEPSEVTRLAEPHVAPGSPSPWRISRFPELHHLTDADRRRVLKAVPIWTYPYLVASSVLFSAIAALFPIGLLTYIMRLPANVGFVLFGLAGMVLAVYFYTVQLTTIRRSMRREIVRQCRGERPPFCFACGYDLHGADLDRCPECGQVWSEIL